jgi:predicted ribosome quality control (RQC) complex YloA/Tae2 family protein
MLTEDVGGYKAGDIGTVTATRGDLPKNMKERPDWCYHIMLDAANSTISVRQREMDFASRDKQLKVCRNHIVECEREIEKLRDKIDFLENYKDQADFVAHKLQRLMAAGKDVETIREVLKELGI